MLTDLRNAKMHSNFGMQADSLFSLQSIICAESRRSSGEIIFTAGNHFSLAVHVWWEEEEEEGKIQPYKCVKACVRSPDDNCTRMLPHFQLKKKKKKSPNHVLKAVVCRLAGQLFQCRYKSRPNVQNEENRRKDEASCIFVGLTSAVIPLQVIS